MIAVVAVLAVQLASAGSLAEDALPPDVVRALEHTAESLDPLIIEGTQERRTHLPDEEFFRIFWEGGRRVEGDRTFLALTPWRFKYSNGKHYIYDRQRLPVLEFVIKPSPNVTIEELQRLPQRSKGTADREVELAFDGEKLYWGSREAGGSAVTGPPNEVIDRPEHFSQKGREDDPMYNNLHFLRFAGLKVPYSARDFAQQAKIRPLVLHMLEHGWKLSRAERKSENNANVLAVTLVGDSGMYVFDLDPSKGYAIVRSEERTKDAECVADLDGFQEFPGKKDVWLPRHCVAHYYRYYTKRAPEKSETFVDEIYTVTKYDSQPIPDRDFVLAYNTPGTVIGDATLPGAEKAKDGHVDYIVPADARDLDEVIKHASEGTPFTPRPRSHRLELAIILSNVLLLVVVVLLVRRYRRRRAA